MCIFMKKAIIKANFLKEMTKKFKFKYKSFQKNIFDEKNLTTGTLLFQGHLNLYQLFLRYRKKF